MEHERRHYCLLRNLPAPRQTSRKVPDAVEQCLLLHRVQLQTLRARRQRVHVHAPLDEGARLLPAQGTKTFKEVAPYRIK